jgi:protein tyrosine/serine phosphatase
MKANRIWKSGLIILCLAVSCWCYYKFFFTNFHTVVDKQFYRSRQLTKGKLKDVVDKYNIRTIINLRCNPLDKETNQVVKEEMEVAEASNASFFCFELVSTKLPRKETLISLYNTLKIAEQPVYFHCYGGADRAGLASALALSLGKDVSLSEMKKQYSWRYLVMPFGVTCGNLLFSKYETWLAEKGKLHTSQNLTAWINKDYIDCDSSVIYNIDYIRYQLSGKQKRSLFDKSKTAKIKRQSSKLDIVGWIFDETGESLQGKLSLIVDGKMIVDAVFGTQRLDVVQHYNLDKKIYEKIGLGWRAVVDTGSLSDGCHTISLRVSKKQGDNLILPTQNQGCSVFRFCLN